MKHKQKPETPFPLRLGALRSQVMTGARKARRSLNSEILVALETYYTSPPQQKQEAAHV